MAHFDKIPANNKQGYKWICIMEGPPHPVTGKRQQVPRRGDTKKIAEERCLKRIAELVGGLDPKKARNMTFEEGAWEWHREYSKLSLHNRAKSTIRARKATIRLLLRFFQKSTFSKITPHLYQKALETLFAEEYAHSYINNAHSVAKMIFEWAISNKLTTTNPTIGAKIPKRRLTVEEIERDPIAEKYLEKDELKEFLAATYTHGLFGDVEAFHLLAFSGMRPGEVCAFKETDINFETTEFRVTKTLDAPNSNTNTAEVTPPKTTGSIRVSDLDEFVVDMIKSFIVRRNEMHERYKKTHDDFVDNGFLFAGPNGRPTIQNKLIRRMARIIQHTSIKKKATPHIFRHTYVSMLTEAGVDLPTIMQRVGHEEEATTVQIYTHVTKKMKKTGSEKSKIYFADILNNE